MVQIQRSILELKAHSSRVQSLLVHRSQSRQLGMVRKLRIIKFLVNSTSKWCMEMVLILERRSKLILRSNRVRFLVSRRMKCIELELVHNIDKFEWLVHSSSMKHMGMG